MGFCQGKRGRKVPQKSVKQEIFFASIIRLR